MKFASLHSTFTTYVGFKGKGEEECGLMVGLFFCHLSGQAYLVSWEFDGIERSCFTAATLWRMEGFSNTDFAANKQVLRDLTSWSTAGKSSLSYVFGPRMDHIDGLNLTIIVGARISSTSPPLNPPSTRVHTQIPTAKMNTIFRFSIVSVASYLAVTQTNIIP